MPANSIECRGLAKHYGDTVVVHSFDFTVAANEFVILLGPSGCGKSTILRMLAGLEDISKGELLIDGELSNDRSPGDRGIAMVFQNYALYPHMTVANNVAFGLRRMKVPEPEITRRVAEVAAILGLEPYLGRRPAELSGGQQQRVAIARAMIKTPRVFLFDEPLSNLDAKLRTHMRIEIARLHRSLKATTIYVTHDQHEAMTLADRIVLLKDGRIEQVGTPEEIFERPLSRFVAGFIGTPPMNFLEMALRRESTGFLLTCTHGSLRISGKHHALGGRDRVTVGIRPVHLKPARADATQDALFGEVELVEYLGHEVQVNLDCGCGQLAAIVPAWQRPAVGERLGFTAEEADIHLFDCNTGASLALGGPNAVRSSRVRELRPLATAQSWSTG